MRHFEVFSRDWGLLMVRGPESHAHIDFWISGVAGYEAEDTKCERPLFGEFSAEAPEPTHSDEALKGSADFHGIVKWDGCSHIATSSEVMVHVCGLPNWRSLLEALARIPEVAKKWGIEDA